MVNLDELTILGSGSEWFWSLAEFVVVAATLVAIFLQLRAARALSLYEQMASWTQEWNDDRFILGRLHGLVDLKDRPVDQGLPESMSETADFFKRLGYLVAEGHLRATDVWQDLRAPIFRYWSFIEPYVVYDRAKTGNPALFLSFETLVLRMRDIDGERRRQPFEPGVLPTELSLAIRVLTDRLRVQFDAQRGVFPGANGAVI